jgi:hypothetical protein
MDSENTLTTSELAGQSADKANEPRGREQRQDGADDDGGRPDSEPTSEAQSESAVMPLLSTEQSTDFDQRWSKIQIAFVDEPRESVERADQLVAELMQRVAMTFAQARTELETQWDSGDDVSTEDLRVALTRYRSFFQRLLAA